MSADSPRLETRARLATWLPVLIADVIVTMGFGDACPIFPGKRYEDWELTDPAGQPIEVVRSVRDDIEHRVRGLIASLGIPTTA